MVIAPEKEWYDDMWAYKATQILLEDPMETKKIKRDGSWYIIFRGHLYKRSFSLPLLRFLSAYESERLIEEMHEGSCGNHFGGKILSLICKRQGYYWLPMLEDAQNYVQKCEKCEMFSPVIKIPSNDLIPYSTQYPSPNGRLIS